MSRLNVGSRNRQTNRGRPGGAMNYVNVLLVGPENSGKTLFLRKLGQLYEDKTVYKNLNLYVKYDLIRGFIGVLENLIESNVTDEDKREYYIEEATKLKQKITKIQSIGLVNKEGEEFLSSFPRELVQELHKIAEDPGFANVMEHFFATEYLDVPFSFKELYDQFMEKPGQFSNNRNYPTALMDLVTVADDKGYHEFQCRLPDKNCLVRWIDTPGRPQLRKSVYDRFKNADVFKNLDGVVFFFSLPEFDSLTAAMEELKWTDAFRLWKELLAIDPTQPQILEKNTCVHVILTRRAIFDARIIGIEKRVREYEIAMEEARAEKEEYNKNATEKMRKTTDEFIKDTSDHTKIKSFVERMTETVDKLNEQKDLVGENKFPPFEIENHETHLNALVRWVIAAMKELIPEGRRLTSMSSMMGTDRSLSHSLVTFQSDAADFLHPELNNLDNRATHAVDLEHIKNLERNILSRIMLAKNNR